MDLSPKLFAVFFLLFLGSNEMQQGPVRVAVARECQSPSHRYKGPCARDANCASVCQTEGFSGGKCGVGFRARCFCVKAC
ncbi:hypothetical protein PVAP13_2NG108400 [Panicum virgatum]|uniref:Knottins-like domain-containing protein n=1 Tax=Panicum virgatum TaxID=38727 RepID=A0A8T0VH24_PANVG|nr:hypothetical protein PVAP13_2NG108400 [Panicum virgatum]